MGGCPLSCSALQASSNASPRISVTRSSKTVPAFRINGSIDPNPNSSHAKIRTPRLIRPDVSNIAHLKNSRSIVFRLIPAIWNREKPSIVPEAFAARALEEVNDFTSAGVEDDLWGPQPRFAARAFASIPRLGFREIDCRDGSRPRPPMCLNAVQQIPFRPAGDIFCECCFGVERRPPLRVGPAYTWNWKASQRLQRPQPRRWGRFF